MDPERKEQVEHFRLQGYVVLQSMLAKDECEAMHAECETLVASIVAHDSALLQRAHLWRLPGGETYLFKIKPVLDISSRLAKLTHNTALAAIVKAILEASPRLIENKLMMKQTLNVRFPGLNLPVIGPEVHRHTDAAYFTKRGLSRDVISVGILLDDARSDSGPLKVWPGTHNRQVVVRDGGLHGPVVGTESAPDDQSIALTAPMGSVIIWHSCLVHASEANTSKLPRRLLVLGYDRA